MQSGNVLNAAILALCCSTAFAGEQPTGEVSGSIADQSGAPLRVSASRTLHAANLEETIVTAMRMGQREVQTLPMAITALSKSELARLGTSTLRDAAALVPAVTFSQNVGFAQLTIRGVGANVLYAGSDPSSAMYLDGVYLARPAMGFVQFLDLDRVEVLRGPQGTLYGRNAVGGAVNLISRPPTNDFEASADVTVGNFDALRASARASGTLKPDRMMGSIAFARGIRDGYVHDLEHPDHPLGGDDATAARGQLRVVFDDRTNLLLSSDVDSQDGTPLTFNKVLAVKPGFHVDNPPDLREVRASTRGWNRTLQSGASARLTTSLTPSTTLISLTAYRQLDFEFFVDADMTELDLVTTHNRELQHQLSQEITIAHEQSGLTWVGGAFFLNEADHQTFWVDQPAARIQTQLDPRVDARSGALFGQATVGLTSRLSTSVGVRYTHEEKEIENAGGLYSLDVEDVAIPGSVYGYSDSIAHSGWTPKIGLELKLSDDALAYVSATRGFKSGGFSLSSTVPGRGYAPEWAWSYEGGWKGTLMNGRSRFSVSAFVMDYTDLQVQTPIGIGVFDIRNAAAATIRGVELEATSRLGRGIEAGGHVTWLDATYDGYIAVSNSGAVADVAGNRLNNAPEWAGRLWIQWSGDIGRSRRLSIVADATAQSEVFYTPFNDDIQRQGSYGLLGVRVEYGPSDRRWAVGAYARNLTNTDYLTATFGTSPAAFGGRPGPSRQFAIEFTVNTARL
jgi:iron complex outermembrane receptor protein